MRENHHDALLVIDVINDLEFPGGENVLPWAERMVPLLAKTRAAAHRAEVPVIYSNDNYGHWRSSFTDVYRHCTRPGARGRGVSKMMRPTAQDYFVLKPKHSAFFATSLRPLLEYLGTKRLILSGISTNLCVLFTAHDAHMHDYKLVVLSDCCAAESDADHDIALDQLRRFCGARVCRSDQLRFHSSPKSSRRLGRRKS
jgi:nicotinamidase-related amidase